jgi:hypothetical protein
MKARVRSPLWLVILLAGLIGVTAYSAKASSGTFQVFGFVTDTAGNPVVNIDVTGDDYVNDLYTFKTDVTGHYSVDFDSDGNYKVYVSCPQLNARGYYCSSTQEISIADGAINIDFVVEPAPFQVLTTSLPRGNVGVVYHAQLAALAGQAPYSWQLAPDSEELPPGLSLTSAGLISGKPETNGTSAVDFQLTDADSLVTNKVLPIVINPQPLLSPLAWVTNRFTMMLKGGSNQNYTLQRSTNLSTWTTVLVTSSKTSNSFVVTDTKATNHQQHYRVMVGP